jgi:hypothetical protein
MLDPSCNQGVDKEDATHHSERHGGGAEEADIHHNSPRITSSKDHRPEFTTTVGGVAGLSKQ